MEDCTRVLVYGSFDGFAYSTDDSIAISVVLDSGEKVEIPEEFIVSADQMINKYKIKLKDVIERIEKFDLGTKAVWINEILNKLGSEYGFHKYCAGYKQGKFDGAMKRERVTVPQYVADFITEHKKLGHTLSYSIDACMSDRVAEWYWDNSELFARAWLDGYEVEQEKRYEVKLKNTDDYLVKTNNNDYRFYNNIYTTRRKHTREEIEKAGFGWVFDCSGIEVEEVEE
ncbi:MAG: DUF1642 domain-containing protein [Bifidobacterium scardovii]|nr:MULTISPECIES: DUF1642 domain-containing protein [Terrabacteria group]MDU2422880.1 DUF1642 domain-containing protein [Bifidobacterium scardovii]